MSLLDKIFSSGRVADADRRERKTEQTKSVVNDLLQEMRDSIRELQEVSHSQRKDYPTAGALHRSTRRQ